MKKVCLKKQDCSKQVTKSQEFPLYNGNHMRKVYSPMIRFKEKDSK